MTQLTILKHKIHDFNTEVYAFYLACRDNRVKWYVRLLLAFAIGYAVSPIDFIPDFIAVFGFLDDIVLVVTGISVTYQLLTKDVLGQARVQALTEMNASSESIANAYRIVGYVWVLIFAVMALVIYKLLHLNML